MASAAKREEIFAANGMQVIKTPVRSPRASSFAGRLVGTVGGECPDHLLILGGMAPSEGLDRGPRCTSLAMPLT